MYFIRMKELPISLRSPPINKLSDCAKEYASITLKSSIMRQVFAARMNRYRLPPLSRLVHMMVCPDTSGNDSNNKTSQLCQNVPWLPEISNRSIVKLKRRVSYCSSLSEKAIYTR